MAEPEVISQAPSGNGDVVVYRDGPARVLDHGGGHDSVRITEGQLKTIQDAIDRVLNED
jgi:hypothetical protein